MNSTTDKIVNGLQTGNREAFTLLYDEYSQSLLKHLVKMTGKKELAEELLHDSLIIIVQKINFYQEDTSLNNSFKSWIFRIATNKAIDNLRKSKNIKFVDELEDISIATKENSFVEIENTQLLDLLFNKLPLIQRTFLNLKINEELNYREISKICGCSINAVKQGLYRARETMKVVLKEEGVVL